MNGRWRFDLRERQTVVVVFLCLGLVNSSFCWSLNDQGLELLKIGHKVVRDAVGALTSLNKFDDVSHDHADPGDYAYRRLLQGKPLQGKRAGGPTPRAQSSSRISNSPVSSSPPLNSPSPSPLKPPISSPFVPAQQGSRSVLSPLPALTQTGTKRTHHLMLVLAAVLGGALFLLFSAFVIVFLQRNRVVSVKPWATGLSGQLQKAFVTGVPKLNRSEIVLACEDFSNIIGSFSEGTVYKGTLSSGVEIAVTSSAVKSRQDWSKNYEEQFRMKIEILSKVNHKNFVNLIGFCEEEEPFTRVMVFEYAPNGALFEHLHGKEAEHLDWKTRLRIAMGMAYCLEHMHQLTPPIAHRDLHSSSVYLTEDYAAKISDFRFWNEMSETKMRLAAEQLLEPPPVDLESNVYRFGVILFEMITGRIPYSVENHSLANWASEYLKVEHSLREMVDPTLKSYDEELEKLFQVIKDCANPDPKERPTMVEIAARLREITGLGPDAAIPKLAPLWWGEFEIISSEGS